MLTRVSTVSSSSSASRCFGWAVLAYGLAIYSTHVYRNHAIETQVESLQSMLQRRKLAKRSWNFTDKQELFGLQAAEARRHSRTHLKNVIAAGMEAWLGESYNRYQVCTRVWFRLKTIIVRDLSGDILAQISDDGLQTYKGCPDGPGVDLGVRIDSVIKTELHCYAVSTPNSIAKC